MDNRIIEEIESALKDHPMVTIRPDTDRCASVLMPVVPGKNGPELLFEIRSADLPQGGEICFPGGALEDGENAMNAAVRETSEELLISRDRIHVIAPMFQLPGPGGTWIRSYFGRISGYEGTWSKDEVSEVFSLPLSRLLRQEPVISHVRLQMEENADFPYELIPGGKSYPLRKMPRAFYFYRTEYGVIWGMTAELLYHLLEQLRSVIS